MNSSPRCNLLLFLIGLYPAVPISYAISEDGKYLAYGLSKGGSDWKTIYVREVATGKDLDDAVPWVKFSGISWTKDNKGFFYSRYPTPAGVKYVKPLPGLRGSPETLDSATFAGAPFALAPQRRRRRKRKRKTAAWRLAWKPRPMSTTW